MESCQGSHLYIEGAKDSSEMELSFMNILGYQIVIWWGEIFRFRCVSIGPYPYDGGNKGSIYKWSIIIWFIEIRKLAKKRVDNKKGEVEESDETILLQRKERN